MAVPLFIFAATVCRFVDNRKWNPEKRLQEFFTNSSGSKMDKTYRPILNQLLAEDESDTDELVEEFQNTIGVIIFLATPLSLSTLAELLEIPERNINTRLDAFHSVLTIPDNRNLPIRTLHLSFHDYLVDERTKGQQATSRFWVDKMEKHKLIASQCLTVMGRGLRKNICELPSYGTDRTEIDPASIAKFLPPALQYACRYWVYHLTRCSAPAKSLDKVLLFLKEHFLHWLESMSISGILSEAVIAVNTLIQLTKDISNNEILSFLSDARRFILKFAGIVDTAPLQLYSSGMIFTPEKALIRRNFERELPGWLSKGPRVEENWSPELQTLEGHSNSVLTVAFSGDGQLLASGSRDKTIRLWDPATGSLKHTLEGHSGWVLSVAFSGVGQLLASGSYDKTIRLWDPATGSLKHALEGHSNLVSSVAFSGDGQLLASGSYDKTIRLWDPATGSPKHTLEGHSDSVSSVAFSGDGQLLASGSYDKTIRLWDPATGSLKQTIRTDNIITNIEFSKHLPLLLTNVGSFNIEVFYESLPSNLSKNVAEVSLSGRWVTIQGQRELWLPPDYQHRASTAKDSTLALGCRNGRVAIIAFSVI